MNGKTFILAAALMASLFVSGSPMAGGGDPGPAGLTRLRSEGGFIKDARGRVTLLRGANVPSHCYKPMKFGEEDLDALQGFGFNFIRLGISWDKTEPKEGEIDREYLASLVAFARRAGERGIYVMPEVHKYGWCAPGSDWPQWACDPKVEDSSDNAGMLKNAKRFWASPELQQKLIDFWRLIILEFRDLDNVMGYNPMNEPLDLTMMVPGLFDKKLFAFYENWIAAARALDPERPACLEPCTANMIVPLLPPRFDHDNLVYAPHPYYIHGGDFVLREGPLVLAAKYARLAREARALSAALLIGEYGGDPDTAFARGWLLQSWELQDHYFASAAIWVYDRSDSGWAIMDKEGKPRPFFHKALRRPYPRFTAGEPIELKYDVEEQKFLYRYAPDPKADAPTEIYLPPELAAGVRVEGGDGTYDEKSETLIVRSLPGAIEVKVEARPGLGLGPG